MTTTSKTIKQADILLSGVSKIILGIWYVITFIVYLMGAVSDNPDEITRWFTHVGHTESYRGTYYHDYYYFFRTTT